MPVARSSRTTAFSMSIWLTVLACCHALAATAQNLDPEIQTALQELERVQTARVSVLNRAAQSVVCIYDDPQATNGGSGVIIHRDGYGLTNFHVIASVLGTRKTLAGLNDGKYYPLTVLGIDPAGDVAMFKLEGRDTFPAAPLGDSDTLRLGQEVAAIGNPFLLAKDNTPTVSVGVISGLHRYQYGQGNFLEYADCIQVSSSINPGNSGGPLFDLQGNVVGINGRASFEERGRVNVGLGYAISINQIKRFIPTLRAGLLCQHGTLGATVQDAGDVLLFDAIQDFSPADRAGVQLGDELVALNGRPINTGNEYNNLIATLPADWPVELTLRQHRTTRTVRLRLAPLPTRLEQPFVPDVEHNHRELRGLLSRFRQAVLGMQNPLAPGVSLVMRVAWESNPQTSSEYSLTFVADGELRVRTNEGEPQPAISGEQAFAITTTAAATHDVKALWREWLAITRVLLTPPDLDARTTLGAADLIDGRLVWPIERRFGDDAFIRWYFQYDTSTLRRIDISQGNQPALVQWVPSDESVGEPFRWPATWTRRTAAGVQTLRILDLAHQSPTENRP